jgi:hypothetical protein
VPTVRFPSCPAAPPRSGLRSGDPLKHAALRRVLLLILPGMAGLVSGCGFFRGAVLLWGKEPTRKVPAEYADLAGRPTAVLVWAEDYTRFEYPNVQFELAEFVRVAVEGRVRGATFVPSREVDSFIRSNPDWDRLPPGQVGQRLGADRVILLELTEYTTREPGSAYLYRGHISANVKVYDTAAPEAEPVYKTTLESVYPPETFAGYGTTDRMVRQGAMRAFAEQLAGKFYERQEKVR